jgi:hypothetical protein
MDTAFQDAHRVVFEHYANPHVLPTVPEARLVGEADWSGERILATQGVGPGRVNHDGAVTERSNGQVWRSTSWSGNLSECD